MKKILSSVALLALAACQQQKPAESATAPAPPPPAAEPATAPAPAAEAKAEPPPPLAPEERAKWYQECWAAFNAKDWKKFGPCYADNATSEEIDSGMPALKGRAQILEKNAKMFAAAFPDMAGEHQLTLVSGNHIAGVVLIRGSNTGPMMSPAGEVPATNKKMGIFLGHVIETTPDGRQAVAERSYADGESQLGQLGLHKRPHRKLIEVGWEKKEVVVATGNDTEKANLEIAKKQVELFNKHDVPGLLGLVTDDFTFSDVAAPTDAVGKPAAKKVHDAMFKGFKDLTITPTKQWAAGDYVVTEGTMAGTNTGAIPMMKLWTKTGKPVKVSFLSVMKLEGGKIKNLWMYDNGMALGMQLGLVPPPPAPKPEAKPAPAAAKTDAKPGAKPATPATPAKGGATPATPATPAAPAKK